MFEVPAAFSIHRPQSLIYWGTAALALDPVEFEILAALIERAGQPLGGAELRAALGSHSMREPAELWDAVSRVNQLLAACGAEAGFIAHTPESGFALVLPAARTPSRRASSLIGRHASLERIVEQLPLRRFISIVGPGGIGKTTLALAVADTVQASYADGVHVVDLAPLAEGRWLPGAVASVLGIPASDGAIDLPAHLRGRQLLLILDSCEHMTAAVAGLVESFLSDAAQVHVIATSREPLRAIGEWRHRLEPMGLPTQVEGLSASAAGAYPGIQLFVERARAGLGEFTLTDHLAPGVAQLCIKLDGIPLAIELAAARVASLGIAGVLSQVEDRLSLLTLLTLLTGGPRRKPQRHRTLEALLDWSHELLSDEEQRVFRRLSVFRGNFSLAAAAAIVRDGAFEEASEVTELVLDLVAKSLVAVVASQGLPTFRLLDTTRAYATAKLAVDPDRTAVLKSHALGMCALLAEAETAWEHMTRSAWRASYASWVNDVRAALAWAFATPGEDELALQLTNLAFPLADQTALMMEYSEWIDRALDALPRLEGRHPLLEIRLRTLPVLFNQREPVGGRAAAEWLLEVLELARAHGEPKCQAGPLVALWGLSFRDGDYPQAWHWSLQLGELGVAAADPFMTLLSKRTGAQCSHYLGDHELACRMAQDVLGATSRRIPWAYFPSPVDSRVSMHIVQVRTLWLQGQPRRASQLVHECLAFARADTPSSLCQTLALAAVPLALWCGDLTLARQWNQQLSELETTHGFSYWRPWWRAFDEVLALWSGDAAALPDWRELFSECSVKLQDQLATFDPRCLSDKTAARVDAGTVGWCKPEVLRARGEVARQRASDASAQQEAEAWFQRALQTAREQGALALELRAASSLAQLWHSQGRAGEALSLLSDARARFTDDFNTVDLLDADAHLLAWAGRA